MKHNYKKQLQSLFSQLCITINFPEKSEWDENKKQYKTDWLKLDYNPVYGGYRIDVVNKDSTKSFFVFSSRFTAKEMIAFIQGFLTCSDKLFRPSSSDKFFRPYR